MLKAVVSGNLFSWFCISAVWLMGKFTSYNDNLCGDIMLRCKVLATLSSRVDTCMHSLHIQLFYGHCLKAFIYRKYMVDIDRRQICTKDEKEQ